MVRKRNCKTAAGNEVKKRRVEEDECEGEEEVYEVEAIRDHIWDLCKPKDIRYLVKWRKYPESANTWEREENLSGAPDVLRNYKSKAQMAVVKKVFPRFREEVESSGCTMVSAINEAKLGAEVMLTIKIDTAKANTILKGKLSHMETNINQLLGPAGEARITIENDVDFELPPLGFTWIVDRKAGNGVTIPEDPSSYCNCKESDRICGQKLPGERLKRREKCCPGINDSKPAYDEHGRLLVQNRDPIYECNNKCSCDETCPNRVVQKRRKVPLCVFKTRDKGWGVKALEGIAKGTFVAEYIGEVITDKEAERREKEYDVTGTSYLFDLDFSDAKAPFSVDATHCGNVSHFFNHSCNPNLVIRAVYVNCLEPDLARLAFFTRKNIKEGEELTFNYRIHDEDDAKAVEGGIGAAITGKEHSSHGQKHGKDRIKCFCGAKNCKKYVF